MREKIPFFPKKISNPYKPSITEGLPKITEKPPKTAANIKKTISDNLAAVHISI